MPHDRFVHPETVTLPLSDDDWLVVKRRVSMGDIRDGQALLLRLMTPAELRQLNFPEDEARWVPDPRMMGIAPVAIWLIDWSLPVPIRQLPLEDIAVALRNLEPEDALEIRQAIQHHEAIQEARREEQKKTRSGGNKSSPISTSRADSAGATSGSEILIPMSTP